MPPKRARKVAKSLRKGSRRRGAAKGAGRTRAPSESKRSGGFTHTRDRALAGTEDVEDVEMAWEYTVASGLSASSESIFAIKGNGLYRPGGIATYGLGLTTSPVGYARMYTQYTLACVMSSRIELTAWASSGTIAGGVPTSYQINVPLRIAIVPIPSAQMSTYASSNVASLAGTTHSTSAYSNNTIRLRNRGNAGMLLDATGRFTQIETVTGDYSAASTGDPAAPWYYVIGVANASSALNATSYQVRIRVVYKVRWYQPATMAIQFAPRDRFGNEESASDDHASSGYATETKGAPASRSAPFGAGCGAKPASHTSGENATTALVESKGDTKSAHVKGFACGKHCPEHPKARSHTVLATYEDDLVDFPGMDSDEEESYYEWRESIRRNAKADNAGPPWAQLKSSAAKQAPEASPLKVVAKIPAAQVAGFEAATRGPG